MTTVNHDTKALIRYLVAEVQAQRLDASVARGFIAGLGGGPEPVAVIGMACRFPDAPNYRAFWRNLADGRQSVGEFPQNRVDDYVRMAGRTETFREGGYLERIDLFDADYFGIPPRVAAQVDPYHRQLMEVLVETMEDAGYCRSTIQGSRTGIFVGNDHTHRQIISYLPFVSSGDFSTIVGSWTGMLASRLAYHFDLSGPAQVLDTGCSSALIALDAAMASLRAGDCDAAFVAGANLFLCPTSIGHETESHGARVRAFDERADGTVWSEGVAAIMVKPLARALADGDPIHGVVLAGAVNNDGLSNGITAPNAQAQKDVIVTAWNRAKAPLTSMGYLEAHGTGTKLGDPIEILGLTKAFAGQGAGRQACAIGSVKSNIGHTVGVAGLASVIKTLLCLENAQIPPSINFETPNPLLDVVASPVFVNDRLSAWEPTEGPRRAGVSSFSLSGTNGHVVLQEAPRRPAREPLAPATHVLALSAHDASDLRESAQRLLDALRERPELRLDDVCHTLQVARDHRATRAVVVCRDTGELLRGLRAIAQGASAAMDTPRLVAHAEDEVVVPEGTPESTLRAAQGFLAGVAQPFAALYADGTARRVSLPAQVLHSVRCWDDAARAPQPVARAATGPGGGVVGASPLDGPSRLAEEPDPSVPRRVVAWFWSQVLGYDEVRSDDSFFALGGDSLSSLAIGQGLNEAFGLEVPPSLLLARPVFDDFVRALASDHGLDEQRILAASSANRPRVVRESAPAEQPRAYELPLTPAQRNIFGAMALDEESLAYNVTGLTMRRAGGDLGELDAALAALVRRHDALRSTFHNRSGRLVQVVHADMSVAAERVDLGTLPPGETHEGVGRRAMADFVRPFRLDEGPLLRVAVFAFDDGVRCVAVDVHHIVTDGSSMGVLIADLNTLLDGATPAPLTTPYRTVITDTLRHLNEVELAPHLDYWQQVFADGVPTLDLPTDRRRPSTPQPHGATLFATLDPALLARAKEYARAHGLTLFMVLIGVLHQLLARRSGQSDIVIGTPVIGRPDAAQLEHIGMFVNTVPVRLKDTPAMTVGDFTTSVRSAVLGAFEHQALPLENLIGAVDAPRQVGRRPLFDVCYAHQNIDMGLEFDDADEQVVTFDDGSAKYDITVTTRESAQGLHVEWQYATALFDQATAVRDLERFEILLGSMIDAGDEHELGALDLIAPAEHALLERLGTGPASSSASTSLIALFEHHAAQSPERTAVVFDGVRQTYAELDSRANTVAHLLLGHGVVPGQRVALLLDRGFDMIAAILGVLKIRAVYVPLSTGFPPDRLGLMVRDADARVLLTGGAQRQRAAEFAPDTTRIVDLDEAGAGEAGPGSPYRDGDAGDPVYLMYTSGTTGTPKGVSISNRGVLRVAHAASFADAAPDDVFLMLSDYSFDGSTYDLWAALCNGASVVVMGRRDVLDPQVLAEAITRNGVTRFFITSSLFNIVVDHAPACLAGVRQVIVGGEALSGRHVARAFELLGAGRLANGYGPTETTVFATVHRFESLDADDIPIGRPIGDTVLRVLDAGGRPVPLGSRGELYVGGGGVGGGYLNHPELTAERFVGDPDRPGEVLYRTGDLVSVGADGLFRYHGRLDQQVKLRGYRVELGEVQRAAEALDGVRWAHCGLVPQGSSQALCLWVSHVEGHEHDEAEIVAALGRRLPAFMMPAFIVETAHVGLTKNGKVDEASLPDPLPPTRARESDEGLTPAEQVIAAAWAAVLGMPVTDPEADFFALGGDSIKAIQIVAALRAAGHHVQVGDLLEHGTVRALAQQVGGRAGAPDSADNAGHDVPSGPFPPSPIQHAFLNADEGLGTLYSQGLLVTAPEPIPAARLTPVLERLVEHHDLLRLRVADEGRLVLAEADGPAVHCEVAPADPGDRDAYLRAVQRHLDPRTGPLLAAATGLGEGGRTFFIAAHHLVVDVVSWGILLQDLFTCLNDPDAVLAPRTMAFGTWTAQLEAAARAGEFRGELPYWRGVAERAASVPDPFERRPLTRGETLRTLVQWDADRVASLLQHARDVWHLTAADTVLAVLVRAVGTLRGASRVVVALEGHGREPFGGGQDVVRTVGWFTSMFPHVVDVGQHPLDTVIAVGDASASLPARGFGFGALRWLDQGLGDDRARLAAVEPQIGFNYLGEQGAPQDGVEVEFLPAEVVIDAGRRTSVVLDVIAHRQGGALLLDLRHPRTWVGSGALDQLTGALATAFDELCALASPAAGPAIRTSSRLSAGLLADILGAPGAGDRSRNPRHAAAVNQGDHA